MNIAQGIVAPATLELYFLQRNSEPEGTPDILKHRSCVQFVERQRRRITYDATWFTGSRATSKKEQPFLCDVKETLREPPSKTYEDIRSIDSP